MKTFPLRVLAPERTFFDGACTSLTVPSIDGIYGLMAQHEDIVLAIVPGKLTLRDADGVEQIAAVSEAPSSPRTTARRSRPSPAPASPARSAVSTSSTTGNK